MLLSPVAASDEPTLGVEGSDQSITTQLRVAEHRFRKKWGGLTAEELAPGPVRPERNRALRILEALELFKATTETWLDEDWRAVSTDYSVSAAGEFAAQHEAELASLEPVFALLDTIDLLPDSDFGIRYDDVRTASPFGLMETINLVKMLSLSGLAELSAGHCGVATRRMEVLLAIGEALAEEPNGRSQIHRLHADLQALALLRALLSRCDLERAELMRLALVLVQDSRYPVEMMLFDNLLVVHQAFETIEEESPASTDEDAPSSARAVAAARLQALRFMNGWFEFVTTERSLRGDAPSLSDLEARVFDEIEATSETPEYEIADEKVEPDIDVERILALIFQSAFQDFETWLDRSDLWRTRFRLARTALALELYAAEHEGRFPDDLDRLVPHYLGLPPVNPFSGELFEYQATENGYRLTAGKDAESHWSHKVGPVLDWSRSDGRDD
jgi:hypothetical protein